MIVTLTRKQQLSPDIWTFYFTPERKMRYAAGQYVEIDIPHDDPDNRGPRRWFTLWSSPSEPELAITTRHMHPASSFKQTLFDLQIGAEVRMTDPMGDFVLPRDRTIPVLCVAGGIGITPMRSMLQSVVDGQEKRSITLLFAAANADDLIAQGVIEASGAQYEPLLSSPPLGWTGLTGRLTSQHIFDRVQPADKTLIYLSGPEPMVETITDDLLAAGYKEQRLVRDYFPGYDADLSN